jgi:hypothetical protein
MTSFFGGASSKTKLVDPRTEEQKRLLQELVSQIDSDFATGAPAFTEEFPGIQPGQATSLAALEQAVLGNGETGSGTATNRSSNIALQKMLETGGGFDPDAFSQYFDQAVQAPALESFRENILPNISRGTAQSGFFGSARREADLKGQEELIDALTQARAAGQYNAREAGLNRVLQASGLAQSSRAGDIDAMTRLFGAETVSRDVLTQQYEAKRQEFTRQLDELYRRLGLIFGVSTAQTLIPTTTQKAGGLGRDLLGPSAQAGGAIGSALIVASSREFKDITDSVDSDKIMAGMENLPIARWKYKGDTTEHIGTFAEDFSKAFDTQKGKTISVIDAIGVLIASNQAQIRRLKALEKKNA